MKNHRDFEDVFLPEPLEKPRKIDWTSVLIVILIAITYALAH